MHYKLIACKVIGREIASVLWRCPNSIDLTMVRQHYHDTPAVLNRILQEEIDSVESNLDKYTNDLKDNDLDAILIGYGLCSNALVGLKSRKYPVVVPRAHDCITLLMGNKEKYAEYASQNGGTFYYTQGWFDLSPKIDDEILERKRAEFMAKFDDEDAVEYLMSIEKDMYKSYSRLTYIEWKELHNKDIEKEARQMADEKKWEFVTYHGDSSLLENMLWGRWDDRDFLVVPPGYAIAASWDETILKAVPADETVLKAVPVNEPVMA
jgi:hypothetical protein